MMKSITLNGTKVKIWATSADARAWVEVENASKLPFIHPEGIAYMPDMHAGASVSIGAVMPLLGVVVPIAIGSDCGCGMRAVKTNIKASTLTPEVIRKGFMRGTRKVVVVGDEPQKTLQDEELLPQGWDPATLPMITKGNGWNKLVRKQLGTLGAGNHFIEFQKDDDDNLWLMIHSGSRGVGGRLFSEYEAIAKDLNKKYFSAVDPEARLAFLPEGTPEFDAYWHEMEFALEWARANRKLMMDRILQVIGDICPDMTHKEPIDIHHNYAAYEEHFGIKCIVHRKGATRAGLGEIGIIPGSQSSGSFIVEGLGNPDSYESCSHGAGRKMSRTEAVNTIDFDKECAMMEEKGIIHAIRSRRDLEEAGSAYKNIEEVLENEKDLVKPLVHLSPIAVLKG